MRADSWRTWLELETKTFPDRAGRTWPYRERHLVGDRPELARAYPEYAPGQGRLVLGPVPAKRRFSDDG